MFSDINELGVEEVVHLRNLGNQMLVTHAYGTSAHDISVLHSLPWLPNKKFAFPSNFLQFSFSLEF